ncbi:hypothetical protein [Gaoshiqia sediminis]|uniref:Uncharacterized protein n=1 Tax=Gaoshiqia sediminis TaxID=2986998 RepID=A0AA42C6H8_9BACT|nr:hypothetical protein [Gaoshiqia sediminis]MCW0483933.1 hypothetical protein [Gaoshiqia sediminis]
MILNYLKEECKHLLQNEFRGLSCGCRKYRIISFLALFFFHLFVSAQVNKSSQLSQLRILRNDQNPIVYFFRDSEQIGRQSSTTWEEWYPAYSSLMGVEGKALPEEVTTGDFGQVRKYFNSLKGLHPEQAVILHICGRARDPQFETDPFFAGHWLYYEGAVIEKDLPAEEGITEIRVSDISLFKNYIGNKKEKRIEDIGLCRFDANGKPDWNYSEQIRLIEVDYLKGTIKVERGCYGTSPKAFKAGSSYAASHVYEGPGGAVSNNLRWYYNHATVSPRDKNGKQASDVFAEQLAGWFTKGGLLEKFDGLEFDVLHHVPVPNVSDGRGLDYDADGHPDGGLLNGYPSYGIGAINFLRKLRKLMGDDKLIMADNDRWFHQRSVGILNGIEHEKFPTGGDDAAFEDWGGGINRLMFWNVNSRKPVFNYIKSKPSDERIADIRLAFAAAVICDAGISMTIPSGRKELGNEIFIWDELRKGQENKLGWLGKGLGPAKRLATESINLLEGVDLKEKIKSANCLIDFDGGTMKLNRKSSDLGFMYFRIGDFGCKGKDLFVSATVKADPMINYPMEFARVMYVDAAGGPRTSYDGEVITNYSLVQDKTFERVLKNMSQMNEKPFTAGFYFREFKNPAELTFNFEGNESVTISDIAIYAAPDVIVRQFEGGLVIANPSEHEVTVDLEKIWPGEKFRRLKGSPDQDPVTNNGQEENGKVTLGKLDGLFLVRQSDR